MESTAHTAPVASADAVRELRETHTAFAAAIQTASSLRAVVLAEPVEGWLTIENADATRRCRLCLDDEQLVVNGFTGWLLDGSIRFDGDYPLMAVHAAVAHYLRSGR